MPKIDAVSFTRVGTYTAELEWLHLWGTDEDIDREFNAVCQTIWGFTLDDFDDDCVVKADHDWLDELTARRAYRFAAENGYDLGDYANGEMVSDWWIHVDGPRRKTGTANAGTTGSGMEKA